MSGFKALNLESDDESDIEVDDTKEIQIEEALKLYQNALKYHAEGPDSYDLAAEAYKQLFDSDIFKYPESQAELQRIELYGAASELEAIWEYSRPEAAPVTGTYETGPSTLPQILHLSHKNYAQFKLDALAAQLDHFNVTLRHILADAKEALNHFVQALDKDDTDLDLWRRTASVGHMLDSRRIARFCLESVLDGDDEGLGNVMSLPGLDEGFAAEQLHELVVKLQDQLSALQGPLSTAKRKTLSKFLKRQLTPYEPILHRGSLLREQGQTSIRLNHPERLRLKAPVTWAGLGDALLRQLMAEQHTTYSKSPGSAICFDMSNAPVTVDMPRERATSPLSNEPGSQPFTTSALPKTLDEQFPGRDHGRPTVQPQIQSADPSMDVEPYAPGDSNMDAAQSETFTLPSRKRSGDAAGLDDGNEEVRTKSRRTRARESTITENGDVRQSTIDENTRWEHEQQLNELRAADDWMFETAANLFERIGVVGFDAARFVRDEMSSSSEGSIASSQTRVMRGLSHVRSDIQSFLDKQNEELGQMLLHGGESLDLGHSQSTNNASGMFGGNGVSKSLPRTRPMSESGLAELLNTVNEDWLLTRQVAWKYIEALLRPGSASWDGNSYAQCTWPEDLKTMVVRTLVNFDDSMYNHAEAELEAWKSSLDRSKETDSQSSLAELTQAIFELHLDIYSLIKQPNSGVEVSIITAQGDRLHRWSELAREAMHCRAVANKRLSLEDPLNLRFLWAATFNIGTSSDVSQDYVIECMNDLRAIWISAGEPTIHLQNNAIMPELSIAALDREISKLTTRDFFLKVTNQDDQDSAALIESLEPLLNALDEPDASSGNNEANFGGAESNSSVAPELVRFLQSSNVSVRLLLWQRLRDAYHDIEYQPMVVYCYLRMIRMILDELTSSQVTSLPGEQRQITSLRCLRLLQNMVRRLFEIMQSASNPLLCIDELNLKLAVDSLGQLLQLLQVFNVAEDSHRIGLSLAPTSPNGLIAASFTAVQTLVHDMQIHIWVMLYAMLKEAIEQHDDQFSTPMEDRFEFLRSVHRNLGLRQICGSSNRAFVRLLKEEFFQMTHLENYDTEQAQVLYDLHRLNCFLQPKIDLMEHKCIPDALLERGVAMQAVDLLLLQANKLPMKDLVKHPLQDTIDKVHGALPRKKPTEAVLRNRETYRAFLRSPILPLDLFSCLHGDGNMLQVTAIPRDDALLASKGWFFLMGQMALTKFRSQKRNGPTPTEDVDIAIAFFMQDLEYTGEHWETWYRLAQAYDIKIEENVLWTAEKLNSSMADIVSLQKNALHCYIMATALAHRYAELDVATAEKMTELYADFAYRMYSSAREPFKMLAFAVDDAERFVSTAAGVQKEKSLKQVRDHQAIKVAHELFKRAVAGKSDQFMLHYMVGKCLWKLHSTHAGFRSDKSSPAASRVLQAFIRAAQSAPDKEKKSDGSWGPLLEPHYKLVSVVHKMLTYTRTIGLDEAKEALGHIPYAQKEPFPESMDGWIPYILAVLRNLRTTDKANWYHRMIARSAQIIYDDSDPSRDGGQNLGAHGAKHELTQQMFTKTMALQVWKPDSEMLGRHFVYTARYTRFFVKILRQLKDRKNIEQVARRMRKRGHDIFEHNLVWQDVCSAYLQLLRGYAALPEGLETSTFSTIPYEEFAARKDSLEEWMAAQETGVSTALDVLREVLQLKGLNAGLMKPGAIDDLIGDAYAYLFNTIGKQLWEAERRAKQEEDARREAEKSAQLTSPSRNTVMSVTSLMNLDGNSDAPRTTQQPAVQSAATGPISATPLGDPAPTRRKVGVGRREIRNCAEQCVQKTKVQVIDASKITNAPQAQVLIERNPTRLLGDASVETSAPGSVHDSADDESELSELDDADDEAEAEELEGDAAGEQKLRFPGLSTVNGDAREGPAVEMRDGNLENVAMADVEMQDVMDDSGGAAVAAEEAGKVVEQESIDEANTTRGDV